MISFNHWISSELNSDGTRCMADGAVNAPW
jgi:hypothetical protein